MKEHCFICRNKDPSIPFSTSQISNGALVKDVLIQFICDQNLADKEALLRPIQVHLMLCTTCVELIEQYDRLSAKIRQIGQALESGSKAFVGLMVQNANSQAKRDCERELKHALPDCQLTRFGESVKCTFASCPVRVDLKSPTRKEFIISGRPSHIPANNNPNRALFELNKSEFIERNLCQFCAKSHDTNQSKCGGDKKPYKCTSCDLSFDTFTRRNMHFLEKHCTDKPYVCSLCFQKFKQKYRLSQHVKTCRNSDCQCQKCGRYFRSQRLLNEHLKVHDQDRSNWKYQCSTCEKKFYKKSNLDSHVLKHTDVKAFVCPICSKSFKRMKALNDHKTTQHSSKRQSHLCSFCGKSFATQTGLRLHLAKHTGIEYVTKTRQCSICEKAFKSEYDLKSHLVVHTKEKPFSCKMCSMSFSQKTSLKDHNNVHTKAFQCPKCENCFGRKRYLIQHQKGCQANSDQDLGLIITPNEDVRCVQIIGEDGTQTMTVDSEGNLMPTHIVVEYQT